MAFEPFGLVGGLSVGIPPILVINDNGVATLNGLTVNGISNLGPIGNVIITGGENGYFLQTDGAGHLTWAPASGGNGSNGTPGGANTQVQFNNAGNFGGDAGFTYDSINNVLSVSGNIVSNNFIGTGNITIANINANGNVTANYFIGNGSQLTGVVSALANVANYAGNITVAAQPNITSVGTLTTLSVTGNVTANYYIGNGSLLTGIANANYAPNANFANFAGNVTVSSQPNITSVGILTTLSVAGNASVGNLSANAVVSNLIPNSNVTYNLGNSTNRWNDLYLSGNSVFLGEVTLSADGNSLSINGGTGNIISNNLSNVPAANVIGQVSNALVSSKVYSNAQPNITSVGTLISLSVTGNVTANNFIGNISGNIANANFASYAGNVTVSSQPNITSVGTLTGLTSSGNITAPNFIGNFVGNLSGNIANANFASYAGNVTVGSQPNITSVGNLTSLISLGNVTAPYFIGNIIGNSTSANFANYAGNVTVSAQPNITSVGTLTSLNVTANINANNINAVNRVTATELSGLVVTATQPNITTLGTLTNLSVAGNIIGGNLVSANFLTGTLTTQTQANIHTVGNLGFLNVDTSLPGANGNITFNGSMHGNGTQSDITISGDITAYQAFTTLLTGTLTTNAQPNITSLGTLIELNVNGPTDLGLVGNITIDGGSNGYVLSTDGTGNLSWVEQSGGGGNGTPGGSNTQIQFNNAGAFGGNSALTFNNTTKLLRVDGNLLTINNVQASVLVSNVATGTAPLIVTSTTKVANLSVETANTATFANTSTTANVAITVSNAAQPNITSVGNLTSLNVTGNILVGGRGNVTGNLTVGNLDTNGTIVATTMSTTGNSTVNGVLQVGVSGSLKVLGNVNTSSSSNVFLGNVENIHISGGINGYVLSTDGTGNLSWSAGGGGGGNGTPGGSNTQVQYNDSGAFGGSAFLTFNEVTNTLQVAGNVIANSTQIGAGVYKFSTQYVYFATTTSTASGQLLWSTPAANVSGVDFHIIATDTAGSTRQSSKISALVYGSNVVWNEYGSLQLNGGTGSFSVEYEAGGIITPSIIKLIVTPDSANSTTYKMMITEYSP